MTQIKIAKNENEINLELGQANRHGLIAGATGTGKTITLKVLAEQFSKAGVPVFMSDVKGDISSIAEAGSINDKIQERIDMMKIDESTKISHTMSMCCSDLPKCSQRKKILDMA